MSEALQPDVATPRELMVLSASREIRDHELVFVGMRLPLLAFMLAKRTHAPRAIGLFENGVIRSEPAEALLYTMSDRKNIDGAIRVGEMLDVMGLLQQGRVGLGFVGAAEVDRFGNLNTTRTEAVRLPGSGGACDIASLSMRLVILMEHRKHRLVERVGYVTSPGYGSGGRWRELTGLTGGGPEAIITDLGVLRFDESSKEAYLASFHESSAQDAISRTGWPLRVSEACEQTQPPSPEELSLLRSIDPDRFWLGDR